MSTERRWAKWLPWGFLLLGLGIFLAGFVYDVIFAGIPYQDPTPELAARYAFHAGVAKAIRLVGGVVSLGGLLALAARFILSRRKSRNLS